MLVFNELGDFLIIMFILVLGINSTYNQYNPFPIMFDPFKIISLVFRFLIKQTLGKNSTLNLAFVLIELLFLLLLGTYIILEMIFISSIFNFVIKVLFLQHCYFLLLQQVLMSSLQIVLEISTSFISYNMFNSLKIKIPRRV